MARPPYALALISAAVVLTGASVAVQISRRKEAAREMGAERLPPPPSMSDPASEDPFLKGKAQPVAGGQQPRGTSAGLADALPAEVPEYGTSPRDWQRSPPPLALGSDVKPDLLYGAGARGSRKPLTGALDAPGKAPVSEASSTEPASSSGLDLLVADKDVRPLHPFEREPLDPESMGMAPRAAAKETEDQGISLLGPHGHPGFTTQTIRSEKEWNDFLRFTGGHDLPVDFRRNMVVAVFSGEQPPRKAFMISSAREEDSKFKVSYRYLSVPEATYRQHHGGPWRPYNCRVVPLSRLPVVFVKTR